MELGRPCSSLCHSAAALIRCSPALDPAGDPIFCLKWFERGREFSPFTAMFALRTVSSDRALAGYSADMAQARPVFLRAAVRPFSLSAALNKGTSSSAPAPPPAEQSPTRSKSLTAPARLCARVVRQGAQGLPTRGGCTFPPLPPSFVLDEREIETMKLGQGRPSRPCQGVLDPGDPPSARRTRSCRARERAPSLRCVRSPLPRFSGTDQRGQGATGYCCAGSE